MLGIIYYAMLLFFGKTKKCHPLHQPSDYNQHIVVITNYKNAQHYHNECKQHTRLLLVFAAVNQLTSFSNQLLISFMSSHVLSVYIFL